MSVTKKVVRQTSKKALSLLLAVVMVMTSMSVCFGTVAFAAGKDVSVTDLANALKFDSIKNATFTGSANNYTVSDPDGKVLAAVEEYFAVVDAMANKTPTNQTPSSGSSDISQKGESTDKTYRTINHLNARVKTLLQTEMGSEYTAYNVDAFITGLLAGSTVSEGTQKVAGTASETNNTAVPTTTLSAAPAVKLTVMMESAITGYTLDNLPESVITSKIFTVSHNNTNYDYAYDYTASSGSGCNKKNATYKHDYWFYYNYSSYAVADGASQSTQIIKDSEATLEQYADYFSMDMDALYATETATLDTVSSAVTTAKSNVVNKFGAGVFTHFFSNYKVDTLVSDITYAKEIQVIAPKLLKAYEDMEKGYDAVITDKDALLTLASTMKTAMDAYNAATLTAQTYVNGKGFVYADVEAFRNAVLREVELIELRALVAEIEATIVEYVGFSVDAIDEGTVTTAMIAEAITTVAGLRTRLDKYQDADVEAIAGETFEADLLTLSNELSLLSSVAGYNDQFADRYAKFASEIFSVTDADGDMATLLSALQSYDSWYTGLKSLIAEMKSVLGEDVAEKLFDDLNDVMTARMDDAYVALNALLEAQIDYAYDLFTAYTSAYGEAITMATVSEYRAMKASIGLINVDAYNFLKGTAHFDLSDDAVAKYTAMQKDFPKYEEFLNSNGFATYETNTIADLERPASDKDVAREGDYKTTDAEIEKIIGILDNLLQNDQVKDILGSLINKDKETGEPTGEPFDLAALINGLLEDKVYSDSLINTIVQYVYPLVAKEFAKTWAGLPENITIEDIPVEVLGSSRDVDVDADLSLYDVETAIAAVGVYLAPTTLAKNLQNDYGANSGEYKKYTDAINVLSSATTKAVYNKNTDEFQNPWDDANLFEYVYDDEGNQVFNDDGTPKQVYKINWGVDEAEDKRAAFIDAACAALSGLEPLLFGILTNKTQANASDSDGIPRGHKIGTGSGTASVKIVINLTLDLTIDPITLVLKFGGNDGYDNALAPIFEALGLENIPHGENLTTTRKILEDGLFGMIDQLIEKVAANPVTFILEALPNLAYALEGGLVEPLLGMLRTEINYYADATYSCDVYGLTTVDGSMEKAMASEEPIIVDLGEMINLKDMGLDISSFQAIWDMIAGGVDLLAGLEAPNAGYIATLGTLVEKDTNRSAKTYNHGTAGKAYHIEANKADVLVYLLKYVLGSGLIDGLVENPEGFVADLLTNLSENPDVILAALVELFNQKEYDTLREFEWFNGYINNESVVGNSAYEDYLNPNNDWTKEKAQYLYDHIDSIVAAILSLAGVDFDVHTLLEEAVGGIFTNETVTALAKLLGKLGDINALLAGGEAEATAEGEEAAAPAIDIAALIKEFLGIDLSVYAQYAEIAEDEVIDFGVTNADSFVDALVTLLAPFNPVFEFLFAGKNLEITVGDEKVELIGYDGYNNAIVPLLEALNAPEIKELGADDNALEVVLDDLAAEIGIFAESLTPIKTIVDILPGVFYFISSKGLSVAVRNLLQGVYVILDTIRPVYDLDLNALINGLLPEDFGIMINIDDIGLDFVFDLLAKLVPELDLTDVKDLIYDICYDTATEYDSMSDLQEVWKKGAYSESFDQADLLTVVLSFLLEWATDEENAKALDELLGTNGLISNIDSVFADMNIAYDTPVWYYWFDTEEKFENYIAGGAELPNTLDMLEYPNNWSDESAQYVAENIADLADMVIGLINKDKEDAANTVSGLLTDLVNGYLNADTVNTLIGLITGLLEGVDENLIEAAGLLLGVDIVGLKEYTCTAEINSVSDFAAELANVLTTYAEGLVNLLFFGDDYRFFSKHDAENKVVDEIVINGGLGYEKGIALVLEVLGCELPENATVETVLAALATRVEAILANPVNEVLDLLPNLVYFLNANGGTVAVNNILAPVYALLDKLAALGVELDLATLLGFDLKHLRLDEIIDLVESKTGLDLAEAEEVLVNLCFGKIEKAEYTYKMVADRADVVTVLLTTALRLFADEDNAAKLGELLGAETLAAVKKVFESAPVSYKAPEWYALDESDIDYDNETIGVIKYAIEYPNNWTEESAKYLADNLTEIGDMVAGIIDSNYDSLGALLGDKVDIYNAETLAAIQTLLGDLLAGLEGDLKDLVNVGLGAADALLGADVQGLLDYDVSGVNDKESFIEALTGMLMEVEDLIGWLLLGQDYKFFIYSDKSDIITLNGGHGYANGLALVLEALGVENLPEVYDVEFETEAVISGVLTATLDRFDAILANPVEEVFNILPNVLYFINSNGLGVAVENLLGAVNALLIKLEGFGLKVDIASLVNFSDILGVETELTLYNITMEAVVALVAELTGLNLDKVADVLVGFALGRVADYDSVSSFERTAMMYYHDEFAKYDMITVLATVAIITLTDEANAEKVKEMLGDNIYQLVLNLINMGEIEVQEFDWKFTDKADSDYVFSPLNSSELYEGHEYGTLYTEEMADYTALNIGQFVNNIIYLLGIEMNGTTVNDLETLINELLGGSLYNSSNVIAIRDALAGVLAKVSGLKVKDAVVGGYIAEILKASDIADINAVANVEVPEFSDDRAQFVASLCDVLEPLYGILKYVLADKDITFFVNAEKNDAITLKGAEGYAYGIIPLLEVLDCKNILTPADYYAAVEADGSVLLTSILNPVLDRVDEILADDPAQAILEMLPNLIYFINSNGVDTVVKNTLNAVFALLEAIKPIKVIDLYAIVGVDFADIDFDWLFDKLLDVLAGMGYEFEDLDANAIAELTTGKLVSYTSANGKTAYKMVYAEGESGTTTDMVVSGERLLVTFIMHENNRAMLIELLEDKLGMSKDASKYVSAVLDVIAESTIETEVGMDAALATIYYVFYGVDTGVNNTTQGYKDLNAAWKDAITELKKENSTAGAIIEEILDWDIFEDILDTDDGLAPNGLVKFFQKITSVFKGIADFFKKLFSFGK